VAILGDEDDRVRALRCIRMELGEPDDSGRRRPVPLAGSEYEFEGGDLRLHAQVRAPGDQVLEAGRPVVAVEDADGHLVLQRRDLPRPGEIARVV